MVLSHVKPRERDHPGRGRQTGEAGVRTPARGRSRLTGRGGAKGTRMGQSERRGGGGQASEQCSEMDGATVRPPQRAGAGTWTPRVTSGVSGRAVSADLGKCRLGGAAGAKACLHWAQEITGRGVERERESPSMVHVRKCAGRGSEKWGCSWGGIVGPRGGFWKYEGHSQIFVACWW